MADGLSIGTVEGTLELVDKYTPTLAKAETKLNEFTSIHQKMSQTTQAQWEASVKHLEELRAGQEKVNTSGKDLGATYKEVDKVLGALGINIGKEVKGLDQLADSAGKTGEGLSTLSKGALVAGAAFAGWNIGRSISQFFDLDKKIGDSVSKLMGWGDVAGEQAAAKADALAAATARAGHEVTTMSEALVVNNKWLKEHNEAAKQAAEAQKKMDDAMVELNSAGDGWKGTLETIDGQIVESIKYYLDAGVSQGALATAYGLTATQVKAVATSLQEEQKALEESNKQWAKEQAELQKTTEVWNEYFSVRENRSATTNEKAMADIDEWFNNEVAKLDYSTEAWKEHYAALEALANEKKGQVGIDWDALRSFSKDTFQEIYDNAERTYQEALSRSSEFSRGAIEHFREVRDEAKENLSGWRDSAVSATDALGSSAKGAAEQVRDIGDAFDEVKEKVAETYTMTFNSLEEVMNAQGLSDSVRAQLIAYFEKQNAEKTGSTGSTRTNNSTTSSEPTSTTPAMTSAAESAVAHGGGGGGMTVNQYINGTGQEVAEKVKSEIMTVAKQGRLFSGVR